MKTGIAVIAMVVLVCGCGDRARVAELERRVEILDAQAALASSNFVFMCDRMAIQANMTTQLATNAMKSEELWHKAWRDQEQEITFLQMNQRQLSSNMKKIGNSK